MTSKIDYDRIEAGWRAGILTPRQLAENYTEETGNKVSHAAIIKHFRKRLIPRNLSARITAESDTLLAKANAISRIQAKRIAADQTPEAVERDEEIVESAAAALTEVRLRQRDDVKRARDIAINLMGELESQTGLEAVETLRRLGELIIDPEAKGSGKLMEAFEKVISLPERSKTIKTLTEALRLSVEMERQSYGIDDRQPFVEGQQPSRYVVNFVTPPERKDDSDDE